MSYARFSYADVYVFLSVYGYLECCGCWLTKERGRSSVSFVKTADMIAHLDAHRAAGNYVPEETYASLREEAMENDRWMADVKAGMCPRCSGDGKCHPNHEVYTVHRKEPCRECGNTNVCADCKGRGGSVEWAARRKGSAGA